MILPWRPVPISGGPAILTSLTTAEAATLRELADGRRVLEIGSAYGYSAITMAQVARHVIAVDPHQGYGSVGGSLDAMRSNLVAYRAANVTIVQAESSTLKPSTGPFGLVFIDGDHRAKAVTRDVLLAQELMLPNGVVACHDYLEDSCPGVRKALDELFPDGPDRIVDTLWIRTIR